MAAPSEVPLSMRKLCGFISSYTCSHSHPGICFPSKHSVISKNSVCGQQRPRSDCSDAQADLGLHYPHMPEDTFSHGMAHLLIQAEICENKIKQTSKCILIGHRLSKFLT